MTRSELSELWQKRMNDFEKSDLTGIQWCKAQDIKLSQFRYWRKKMQLTRPVHPSNQWTALAIEEDKRNESLLIHLGQASIEVHSEFNPDSLVNVIRVLRSL